MSRTAPLNDEIIVALARLIDDSQTEKREPSHSDIEFQIERFGLSEGDPSKSGPPVGKAKRVRGLLTWSLDNNPSAGEAFVVGLISTVRGCGGFRELSPNYCGTEAVNNLRSAFLVEGWELLIDGILQPKVLDSLRGIELNKALRAYAVRARRGALDSPLLAGTSKDLLEATAAHVVTELWGTYQEQSNFPTLLGQAFIALGFATPKDPETPGELAHRRVERALYETACSINALRNKEGTGHGRPWVSGIKEFQARYAIETMGSISELLLAALSEMKETLISAQ